MECLTSKQQQDQTRLVFLCQEFHQHESQMHWLSQHIPAFFLETWEPDVLKTDEQNTHFTGCIPMLSISAERVGAKSMLSRKLHAIVLMFSLSIGVGVGRARGNGTFRYYAYNRPLACPWKCSQSGGQNNKICLHENRSQFPKEKLYFVLSSRLATFPSCVRGLSLRV